MYQRDFDFFLLYAALLLEQIWFCRNHLVFNSRQPIISNIAFHLRHIWSDFPSPFKSVHAASHMNQTVQASSCWCPPPTSFIKINVDVAYCGDLCLLGLGARNWRGEVSIIVVEAATAKAILLALQLC